ncbi:amino acid ABC transporter substrate-binding protein [Alsobacter sp. SYSU M60028]|uniref:Amino acid ABC transporter substrate-binding protein n=1 Tax=Alsobacter ponti TaxID=2962936 RepID=A0ABT1LA96_9HYPH|nr:amino acid ABC transporter substrate-binding protein [Alsobacter ponti]MCP8938412.1 amino acid ABC transporter substrate-binding protein [Alsobacter ponti]
MPAKSLIRAALAAAALAAISAPAPAQTLKAVKERGQLICGISQGVLGFSTPDDKGGASGFDADFCRAVAAAALGDPTKVKFVPLSAAERFTALKNGQIDLLSRNSTWTMSRETEFGLAFPAVLYVDGQGFLLPKSRNVTSALELTGAKVCVQKGTTTADNLGDYFTANGMTFEAVTVSSPEESLAAYQAGKCNVMSSDISQLYGERLKLPKPTEHMILPDVISKEPLAPVVRGGDGEWFAVVKWVVFALINAEELGVTSRNTEEAASSQRPDVRRLVGADGSFGEQIGLNKTWAASAIRAVGNYGEMFERNVGSQSKLGIPRGVNQNWLLGGILFAPPIR